MPAPCTGSEVYAAAEGGWFVGSLRGPNAYSAVRWHGAQVEAMSPLAEVRDINSAGAVVGDGGTGEWWASKPVVNRGGQTVNLAMPRGFRSAKATHINNSGDVVGVAYGEFGDVHPVLWAAARPGTAEVLNPDPQHLYDTYPVDVDEQGRVLLYTDIGERSGEVFVRATDGGYRQLPPLYPGGAVYLEAFHGGRIAASVFTPESTMAAIEADLDGNVVHTTTEAAENPVPRRRHDDGGRGPHLRPRELRTPHLGERRTRCGPGRQRRLQRGTATGGAHRRRDAGRDDQVAGSDATAVAYHRGC
ncbi:hypothetical protein MUY14_19930 [Amycolatopsis sp. FBCC-B4732]|uniref:hypothetical protein n=1 Tax=Amycolatopsis sp. FBCC-B4732 TaxID=3079339 RepID=UPI001FF4785F|nr:hypothetical protein [Amycolatopsis sp. FBCC-B4732]UOX92780.1 hypothetical protein MUY14_19930 [Amycolatopsis sp. FBCC-B4732]